MTVKPFLSFLTLLAIMQTGNLKATQPREVAAPSGRAIYHCIRYTIDPQKVADFESYARRWMEGGVIKRCGGEPLGYFIPKKGYGGPDNIALALIGFDNLTAYEEYRKNWPLIRKRERTSNSPESQAAS